MCPPMPPGSLKGLQLVVADAYRAREMGLKFGETELKAITRQIKELADKGELSEDEIDKVLREWVTA